MTTLRGRIAVWLVGAVLPALVIFVANAGKLLVVDDPKPSDVIVVLAGETEHRPSHALELLQQGYGRRVLIDVPAKEVIYDTPEIEIAQRYVQNLRQASAFGICPVVGLSTRDESHDVEQCLVHETGTRILLVTSPFHTRRALSTFRHELRGKVFTVAAARDDTQFGIRWWAHRQWAKTCVDEWLRLLWWNAVERWQ
jgi:uncharacterized SAM-binding protein YcdF (DUF218 family)